MTTTIEDRHRTTLAREGDERPGETIFALALRRARETGDDVWIVVDDDDRSTAHLVMPPVYLPTSGDLDLADRAICLESSGLGPARVVVALHLRAVGAGCHVLLGWTRRDGRGEIIREVLLQQIALIACIPTDLHAAREVALAISRALDEDDANDDEHRREMAREAGMVGGCDAYNDAMGWGSEPPDDEGMGWSNEPPFDDDTTTTRD